MLLNTKITRALGCAMVSVALLNVETSAASGASSATAEPASAQSSTMTGPAHAAPNTKDARANDAQEAPASVTWNARTAEHLLNRAGFGARPAEIDAAVRDGQMACIERLLAPKTDVEPFFIEQNEPPKPREMRELPEDEAKKLRSDYRERDRKQLLEYMGWWFERMSVSDDPLLERMVLFWHGFFTTSAEDVKRSYEVLRQNQFIRDNALGSYAVLLRGITRDPAMLTYLDNQVNRKGNPNENFARELMELFSLGQGNYSEQDVKEAARALTGRGSNASGEYEFRPRQHDEGLKTILGVTGKLDGDALVDILLKQDACSQWVAKRLITYFEGVEPAPGRLTKYAALLRENQFELRPFLLHLFRDPAFYRADIIGARVQSPVEFMVGMSRRLGIHAPPVILGSGAALLGQRLFAPPSVKGWDEGEAWITTASLMQRGNLAGLMLGVVKVDDVLSQADLDLATPTMSTEAGQDARSGDAMNDAPMTGDGAKAKDAQTSGDGAKSKDAPMTGDGAKAKSAPKDAKSGTSRPAAKGGNANKGGVAYQALRKLEANGWMPTINFSARMERAGMKTDAQIVDRMLDELLAIDAPADTRKKLREFLAQERASLGVRDGRLSEAGPESERVLRRLAHLVLSLPEAQLE